ncbi:ABC transporter ATP-binding protein [Paracoccus pacificus]|uniref:ABC transporter ATP-binding protein n=1 Tax=Paracoccus pacificus TaxID=1463598 RepID=A0ABW4R3W3_9RHOB
MTPNQPPALELDRISRWLGGRQILSDITVSIPTGKISCLLGQSGCGKSTLLRLISGVDRPDGGRIRMDGQEIVGDGSFVEPESRNIGFMFQDYALFPHISVAANLAFGLRGMSKAEQQKRVNEVVDGIGIRHLVDRFPHSLSGGEQQRVALARALAPKPAVLLMDEPFSNLDQGLRERVRKETVETLRKLGTTAIIVTHDPQEALAVGDLIILMREGKIEQIGSPFDIYDHPVSPYAAEFMGPCNRLTGIFARGQIETPIGKFQANLNLPDGALAVACIRPQALTIESAGDGIAARILAKSFLGESEQIDISVHPLAQPLRVHSHQRIPMAVGQQVSLHLNHAEIHVFADAVVPV